ncbi:putative NAM7-nonsense-mediated mRNA decay protein [Fasciola gigantica]|uniref:Putative NAM7-nonsense-mediated mRNA decay protein n=1 Tax=Fasciola gigantica TaxID=46835 RepID=A0A504Z8W9_FASGI|nr:putative NAM7-nonsense-mediated mRNA decay protein [Fasciola gigantica]
MGNCWPSKPRETKQQQKMPYHRLERSSATNKSSHETHNYAVYNTHSRQPTSASSEKLPHLSVQSSKTGNREYPPMYKYDLNSQRNNSPNKQPPNPAVTRSRSVTVPERTILPDRHTVTEIDSDKPTSKLTNNFILETRNVKPMQLRYSDLKGYAETLEALVKLESEYEKKSIESLNAKNIVVRWDIKSKYQGYVYFRPLEVDNTEMDFTIGQRYRITPVSSEVPGKSIEGELIQIPDDFTTDYCLCVRGAVTNFSEHNKVNIEALWNGISFERMCDSLKIIKSGSISSNLRDCLCGKRMNFSAHLTRPLPKEYTTPGVDHLDDTQKRAIQLGLDSMFCLIQGPPGSGKTTTSACLIYHLNRITGAKVIAVAPSNLAVDKLCSRVAETGLNVVRLCAPTRERLSACLEELTVHRKAQELVPELFNLQAKKDRGELKSSSEMGQYLKLKRSIEIRVLQEADVICCTCVMAADRRLYSIEFTNVLIDECGQALEPECLIPISRDVSRLILVGDQCQLGPVVHCPEAAKAGLDRSLFQRFCTLGAPLVRLEIQYRMHPELSRFPSRMFYDNQIRNGVRASERTDCCLPFWPNPNKPTFFYLVRSEEQRARNGLSYLNRREAQVVKSIILRLIEAGVRRNSIGVIAPYDGQKTYLVGQLGDLANGPNENVEISTVDGYQGREKDYIILSCVRSNQKRNMGFLKDPRRLNVALTRARYGLILIGDPNTLSKDPLWYELLRFYHEQNLLVEGPLKQLRRATMTLLKPRIPYAYKPRTDWLA